MSDSDSSPVIGDAAFGADRARASVNYARRMGRLPPPSDFECVDCGAQAQVYDHRDYNKPLDVAPVCQSCNVRRGAGIPFFGKKSKSAGYECSALGIERVTFEAVDFYPAPEPVEAPASIGQEGPSLESCWR